MFGLGKKRSRFGKFLDKYGITQEELSKVSKVNRNTISRIASSNDNEPSFKNAKKIIKALNKEGYNVDYEDFWG
ncbi:helix-turn-helix domain-containing protein [Pontibacillus yanchengensis]|uniref:Helix-turn-helix domain-containing protein n=1 Tax=Pontibacillus yanchengensis TaxID=462910 RepID=A0ACC7VEC4_9BACI|nr:helix-turn-helix transcriptional regulator [Pontibacillus yanchengensis]MYL53321.1 helix-turn-helix domain-containing protein [Pontibacillus yanchengensis]